MGRWLRVGRYCRQETDTVGNRVQKPGRDLALDPVWTRSLGSDPSDPLPHPRRLHFRVCLDLLLPVVRQHASSLPYMAHIESMPVLDLWPISLEQDTMETEASESVPKLEPKQKEKWWCSEDLRTLGRIYPPVHSG